MTNRTVKILGWGEGTAKITAILDGETVFSGNVDLVEMSKENETIETAPTLFTFDIPIEFAGTKHMVISVAGTTVRFGQIVANYTEIKMGDVFYSTGADEYADVSEFDDAGVCDPRANVTIDGEKQEANRLIGKGTWHWPVDHGSTLEHDLNIKKPGLAD